MKHSILVFILLNVILLKGYSQSTDTLNVDNAFQLANTMSHNGQREEAKALCKRILKKSPGYSDVSVLLARIYIWTDDYEGGRIVLKNLLSQKPYEDAYIALVDLERWDDHPEESLLWAQEGLNNYPESKDLMLKKAQALNDLDQNKEAYKYLDTVLRVYPNYLEARDLFNNIRLKSFKNAISVSYALDHFEPIFEREDWHLGSISYTRSTKLLGSVVARFNYGRRFESFGKQIEVDMYPSLGKKMYGYFNFGYSGEGIFPTYRAGVSIYRSFPRSFEGEIGFRQLQFDTATTIYTASIGKYMGNFWFNIRGYYTKTNFIDFDISNKRTYSQTYYFMARYYFGGVEDHLTLGLGTGVSPDDATKVNFQRNFYLKNRKITLGYNQSFKKVNIFNLTLGLLDQEFTLGPEKLRGIDYFGSVSFTRLF